MDPSGPAFSVWDEVYGSYVSHTLHPAFLNTNWGEGESYAYLEISPTFKRGRNMFNAEL